MQIRNIMEEVVQQNLPRVLQMYPACCTCDKCQQDILLLALNNLPPKYISTQRGDVYTRLKLTEIQDDVKLIEEIAKAVEIVMRNPRHKE